MNVEQFLTDDFVSFSQKIGEVHAKIKQLDGEFREQLKAYKKAKAELEAEAKAILDGWQAASGEKKEEAK